MDAFPISAGTAARIGRARSTGTLLPSSAQGHLEGVTGRDLGGVRIHTDALADRLAKGVRAKAFTSGSDVFFRSGRFDPTSPAGSSLLKHEIGHVVGPRAPASVIQRDEEEEEEEGGFGGEVEEEAPKGPVKDPEQLADEFPQTPDGAKAAREEAVKRIQAQMNVQDAAGNKLEAARLERQFLLAKYTWLDYEFQSVDGVEEFIAACRMDSVSEAVVLQKLGPRREWSLVITPQAFPETWANLVKQSLDLGIDSATLQAQAREAWDNLNSWGAQVPPYVVQDGLPVEYKQALALQTFKLSGDLAKAPDGGAVASYAQAALRYRFSAYKSGFVAGWQQFVATLVANVRAGETVVDAAQIDDMAHASSRLGEMARAAGPPGEDGYRDLDTDLVNLQEAGFLVALVAFFQSMTTSGVLWKQASDLFDQKMAEADAQIKGTGFMDNIGKGFWWAFAHGYFQGAVVATAMAIYEHKGEIFAKLSALVAALAALQGTPFGWIADVFGGLVILDALYEVLSAFKAVGSSDAVVSLQRNSAKLAQTVANSITTGVLAYVIGSGVRRTAEAAQARMERYRAGGASEKEAAKRTLTEPVEAGIGVSKPVTITAEARGAPSRTGAEARVKAQKDEFSSKEMAADVAAAAKAAPKVPRWTLTELINEAKFWAERGMGKWIQRAQVEGRIHVLSKQELQKTFGESVGAEIWADIAPSVRGAHIQGHVFVRQGLSLQSAASTLVHEVTHLIQHRRIGPFQATFESEFQALTMQKRYLRQLPPKDVPEDVRWLYHAESDDIASKILERYGTYKPMNEAEVDALIKQVTDQFGTI
jgi:Domain of unknown function (DUF4157)